MVHPAFKDIFADDVDTSKNTVEVTQTLKTDIIQFLIARYTEDAIISVSEVQTMYKTSEGRARRVLDSLVDDEVLRLTDIDSYRVMI